MSSSINYKPYTQLVLLDLNDFKNKNEVVFVGSEYGRFVASLFNLKVKVSKDNTLLIVVPDDVLAMSPSFFRGLFESLPYETYKEASEKLIVTCPDISKRNLFTNAVTSVLKSKYGVISNDNRSGSLYYKEW